MKNFYKIPSVVQILIADLFIIFCLSSFVTAVWNTLQPGAFGEFATLKGVGNWIWFLLGFAIFGWMMVEIFRPKVKGDSYRAVNINSWIKTSYSFCSTHPSYVLIDLAAVIPVAFLTWYASEIGFSTRHFIVMLTISAIVPVLRLFGWFVIGLKIAEREESRSAWKPVAWFGGFVFSVYALVGVLGLYGEHARRKEIADLPVIDAQTFSREALTKLHDDKSTDKQTKFVRLRAVQINDQPVVCQNKDGINFARVSADLGKNNQVLIVGAGYSGMGFEELTKKSRDNQGKQIEVIGKMREISSTSDLKSWQNYCDIDKILAQNSNKLLVLEMQNP